MEEYQRLLLIHEMRRHTFGDVVYRVRGLTASLTG
jgi:hypothetical protein